MEREGRHVRRPQRPVIPIAPATPRAPLEKRQRDWGLWFRRFIFAIFALGFIWLVYSRLQLKTINIEPSEYSSDLLPQVEKIIADHRGWNHLLWLNSGDLAKELSAQNKATFTNIKVEKVWFGQAITVKAGERTESMRWQTNNQVYVLDGKGVVIRQIAINEAASLPLVVDGSNLPVEVNKNAVSSDFASFTVEANKQVKDVLKLGIVNNRIIDTSSELLVVTDKGYYIRFDTTGDLVTQIDSAARVLKTEQPKEYLDVRIPYKAYYR